MKRDQMRDLPPEDRRILTETLRRMMMNLRCVEQELSRQDCLNVREVRSYLQGLRVLAGAYVDVPERDPRGDETSMSRESMRILLTERLPSVLARLVVTIETGDTTARNAALSTAWAQLIGICVTVDDLLSSPTLALRDTLPGLGPRDAPTGPAADTVPMSVIPSR
jgi:hypothetical protein